MAYPGGFDGGVCVLPLNQLLANMSQSSDVGSLLWINNPGLDKVSLSVTELITRLQNLEYVQWQLQYGQG